jgi:hypothetical protein
VNTADQLAAVVPSQAAADRITTVQEIDEMRLMLVLLLGGIVFPAAVTEGGNFSAGGDAAVRFGVHEVVLTSEGGQQNPFDTLVTVTFTPGSDARQARRVNAFYDGDNTWRARVYVSQSGPWRWESQCQTDTRLDGKSGGFTARESELRGRLLPHPNNPRQWITEDGQFFLNLSDTAYFLLCRHDGNGDVVTDDDVRRYVCDDVQHGITAVRCFLASRQRGFTQSASEWEEWFFQDEAHEQLRLTSLQGADRRLRLLLDEYPDVAVQLVLFPLEAYARDDRFWTALSAAQRERLLRNLVARYAAYPQLQWLITNDAHYGPKFPNSNAHAREVGAYLQEHDPWQHPRSTGHARRLPFVFGEEDWATYVHIEHQHDLGALQYGQYHALRKPVFLGEDRYEQDHGSRLDPVHMRYWQRRLFWSWLLSGGSANYGGRWWVVHPYSETGQRATAWQQRPAVTFTAPLTGLDSVRPIRDYFTQRKIDLGQFAPDSALVQDAAGSQAARAPRLVRRGRDEFLIYHPHAAADDQAAQVDAATPARLRLDLREAPGTFAVEWYRAEDGATHDGATPDGGQLVGGQWRELTAPWQGADVVLRLTQRRP